MVALALTALKATKVLEGLLRPAPPEEKISDFRFEHWYQDGWCWAAATTMVQRLLVAAASVDGDLSTLGAIAELFGAEWLPSDALA